MEDISFSAQAMQEIGQMLGYGSDVSTWTVEQWAHVHKIMQDGMVRYENCATEEELRTSIFGAFSSPWANVGMAEPDVVIEE